VAKPGVSKWGGGGGGKGEGREGVGVPSPAGGPGAVPRRKFKITDACRRVLAHFSYKNQHTDACIYACKLC
jgi:hypothetical protein